MANTPPILALLEHWALLGCKPVDPVIPGDKKINGGNGSE
jgi:hypothetical protein